MLLAREHMRPEGELEEDHIVVTVTQPMETSYAMACQVRKNMDAGIGYAYCFYGDSNGMPKICLFLQMLLVAPMLDSEENAGYRPRMNKLMERNTQDKVIADLESICAGQHMKIYLLKDPPALQYVIHNADSETDAVLYLKNKNSFIEWERGDSAYKIWGEMRKRLRLFADSSNSVFFGASGFDLKQCALYGTLKMEMKNKFPVIYERVIELCCDGL